MKPIKTRPRFRCDFCRKTGMAATIERHELICWQNPNRHCETCNDTGIYTEWIEHYQLDHPCPYCSQRSPDPR